MRSRGPIALLLPLMSLALAACGGSLSTSAVVPPGVPPAPSPSYEGAVLPDQTADRQVVVRAAMDVTVEDPRTAAAEVENVVESVSGYVDASRVGSDEVEMSLRVPAATLDQVLDGIRPLGRVKRETANATDVTSRAIDLEARLESLTAVRDRLRGYVERATTIAEIIEIEQELTRVQTEIERLTGELQRLRSQVAMSALDVTLERRRTDGPLTAAGKGVAWFFEKLVFWN